MAYNLPESVKITVEQNFKVRGEGGVLNNTNDIELVCFSRKQYRKTDIIQQGVAQAVVQLMGKREELRKSFQKRRDEIAPKKTEKPKEEKSDSKKKDDLMGDPSFIKFVFKISNVNVEPMRDCFDELALGGCVKIGLDVVREDQLDEMDPETQDDIFFGWLANFMVPLAI